MHAPTGSAGGNQPPGRASALPDLPRDRRSERPRRARPLGAREGHPRKQLGAPRNATRTPPKGA
eukprot:7852385-Alexandrium_andersonii.AAC.1